MKNVSLNNHDELDHDELIQLNAGGSFLWGVLAAITFHVIKEAYNDWEGHVDAFNEGINSANS